MSSSNNRSKWYEILHPFDWFSKPITLVYNHKKTHETVAGAVVTLICLLLIGWDAATTFVKYSDPKYTPYNHSRKLVASTGTYDMDIT